MSKFPLRRLTLLVGIALSTGALAVETPTPRFPVEATDPSVGACNDLNKFANGKWMQANPIPADQVRWGSFLMLREQSLDAQHKIVDDAVKNLPHAKKGSVEQKIGELYAAGMDEAKIEKLGYTPIKPELAAIAKLKSRADVIGFIERAHARGDSFVFGTYASADYKNAQRQIAFVGQSGLSLPTPEYYTSEQFAKTRQQYVDYLTQLFTLTGVKAEEAKTKAEGVLAFETRLAKASTARVEMRKPENQYRMTTVAEANKLTPLFDWAAYFKTQKIDVKDGFSLAQPNFFAEVNAMLETESVDHWRDYLAAHTINGAAPLLSKAFVDANFGFFGKQLNGQPEQQARWKRVLNALNSSMGQALGQIYVKDYFPPASKARMQELVANVTEQVGARVEKLEWMSPETKVKAKEKWLAFFPKIGYPDTWRDWSGLHIEAGNYYASAQAAQAFNSAFNRAKIGKPTDRMEWGMTPQTVNAYYNPLKNEIVFPAAILQPPFFDPKADDALNYGGIGAVIGHEMMHGYDDEGSKFDATGNLADWWTKEDRTKFEERTARLVKQFDDYVAIDGLHVKGRLTLGENIADLGGINVAYDAFKLAQSRENQDSKAQIDGLNPDQRFFINFAQVWRRHFRPEELKRRLNVDPHAPAQFRAIAAPSNMHQFAETFSCKAGDPMIRSGDKLVKIW